MTHELLPYLGVVALITATPGPDTLLVTRNAARGGFLAGLFTAAGSASGLLLWGAASTVGVAAVLTASASAFEVLRFLGAAYLLVMGLRLLRSSGGQPGDAGNTPPVGGRSPFLQGLLTNLLNPKAAAFFTAVLPQFIPHGGPILVTTGVYAAIAAMASFTGLCVFAAVAYRARAHLQRPGIRKAVERLTGVVLIGLSIRLAAERT